MESTRHAFAAQNVNGADGLREPQLRGALDVLRDGALDFLRDKKGSSTDNINETIDKIRTGFQEKVKEIDTGSRLAADRQPGQAWRDVATPVMSDGRDGPPLELRGLFEQFLLEAR